MKTTLLLTIFIYGDILSAFTVDFTQHVGESTTYVESDPPTPGRSVAAHIQTPLMVNVPGYGNVELPMTRAVPTNPQAAVGNFISTAATELTNGPVDPFSDQTEACDTFGGEEPMDIDFDFVDVGLREDFDPGKIDHNPYPVSLSTENGPIGIANNANQAAPHSVSFNAVPEPSSALLSSLAALALLRVAKMSHN
jgi:hypothetical protein